MLISIDCPICETNKSFKLFSVEKGLEIVQCENCDLVYFNPNYNYKDHSSFVESEDYWVAPAFQELRRTSEVYLARSVESSDLYIQTLRKAKIKGYPDYLHYAHLDAKIAWGNIVKGWVKEYTSNWSPKSVLGTGVATGHMFVGFKKENWKKIVGIELSKWAVDAGKKDLPWLDLRQGTLNEIEFEANEKFDVLLCWDSFEHEQYPNETLKKLDRLMNNPCVGVFHLPNWLSMIATMKRKKENKHNLLSPGQHCFFYTHNTLDRLLRKHNFKIIGEKPSPEVDEMVKIIGRI